MTRFFRFPTFAHARFEASREKGLERNSNPRLWLFASSREETILCTVEEVNAFRA